MVPLVAPGKLVRACLLALLGLGPVPEALALDPAELAEASIPVPPAPGLGDRDAPVVMVVLTDYQCPYCRAFARQVMPRLEEAFVDDGQLRIEIVDLPLPSHDAAFPAAMAASCAGRQDRYWEMHRWLFAGSGRLTASAMRGQALALGLDMEAFEACLQDPATVNAIEADMALARAMGVSVTPSFLIGRKADGRIRGKLIRGLTPYGFYAEVIRRQLPRAEEQQGD